MTNNAGNGGTGREMCDSEHLFKPNKKDQNFEVFFTVMKQALQVISTYNFNYNVIYSRAT